MPRLSGLGWRREIESPSRLGLETIIIAPFHERTDLTTRAPVRSLDIEMGRC